MHIARMTIFCECGYAMYPDDRTLRCKNPRCGHYEELFKVPSVELEPVPEENAPREASRDDQTRP